MSTPADNSKRLQCIVAAYDTVRNDLIAARNEKGFWEGQLSSSALAAATAISAMSIANRHASSKPQRTLIERGLAWLLTQQNNDGGWGDTPESISNISTTMLALAAIELAGATESNASIVARGNEYVENLGGIPSLRARYGRDKTFAVPILTNAALAGQVAWSEVSRLPFELAALPQSFYRFVRMPVVSYAIPALVAVGQAIHYHRPPNPIFGAIRNRAIEPSLRVLMKMQPQSGGYLEAIPLTSFVVMSLASIGRHDHPVVKEGLKFIVDTARDDGSWPIDTNLATWATSLSINALPNDFNDPTTWQWLLNCQHLERHPFTGADPGGWGWSDLSGAVPDSDDTPAALLAIAKFCDSYSVSEQSDEVKQLKDDSRNAAISGTRWLFDLQNRDGGWPTFCRGWGKLPFDRSGTDLTAHALRALLEWKEHCDPDRWQTATDRGWKYIRKTQASDGSWLPLWFGNQSRPDETNPVYGTARVLMVYRDWGRMETNAARRGVEFLVGQQDADGGWGAGPESIRDYATGSVEETSLAIEALLGVSEKIGDDSVTGAIERGLDWLTCAIEKGQHRTAKPIGLYFAKLWYDESLYPLTFATAALRSAIERSAVEQSADQRVR